MALVEIRQNIPAIRLRLTEHSKELIELQNEVREDQNLHAVETSYQLRMTFRALFDIPETEQGGIGGAPPRQQTTYEERMLKQKLDSLEETVDKSIQSADTLDSRAHKLSTELKNIASELDGHMRESKRLLEEAEEAVEKKKRDQVAAQNQLDEENRNLRALESKMERTRDHRVGLRVGRVAAWGATLIFPPAGLLAAGLEVGAHEIRKKTRQQQEARNQLEAKVGELVHTLAELGEEKTAIKVDVESITQLSTRCADLVTSAADLEARTSEQASKCIEVAEVVAEFAVQAPSWHQQATLLHALRDDQQYFRSQAPRLAADILTAPCLDRFKTILAIDTVDLVETPVCRLFKVPPPRTSASKAGGGGGCVSRVTVSEMPGAFVH